MKDELHTLSGAYAVHALPYAEWVRFEQHLHVCQGCSDEVRRLRETAAKLAESVAEPPPTALRGRLLAAAHRSRDPESRPDDVRTLLWTDPATAPHTTAIEPPVTGDGPHPTAEGPYVAAPGPYLVADGGLPVPARRRTRVMAALTAVCAAAAVALGVVAFDARRDLEEAATRNERLVAVLAAPDAETLRRPITAGGTGTIVVSRDAGGVLFTSSGLPELPATKAYELWLMDPRGPRPAGLLHRGADGMTAPLVLVALKRDDRVALTVEPAGGSDRPTTRPILLAELPRA
ncbi:anti-sigma factor [Nonomuraea fuscirosea]|jgi:anti-sigma-K factor RskA|uniref:anti-sigma factor n=1 Tax=Nonomuraea fuscirosea TaxID=1291556 RepID=UPI002DD87D25|nr:anti-sigma factor [Nonomuraea fuscirosea]WSA57979.1 anti-sigma factor [Nonomuraea fuscirosea]